MGIFGRIADIFKGYEKHLSEEEKENFERNRALNVLPENIHSFQPKVFGLMCHANDKYCNLYLKEGIWTIEYITPNQEKKQEEIQLTENQKADLCFILAYYNFFEIKCERRLDSIFSYNCWLTVENNEGLTNTVELRNDWIYFRSITSELMEDLITCLQLRKYIA